MISTRITELEALLRGTGITSLTLSTPEETITLRREARPALVPAAAAAALAPEAGLVVGAPCCGTFLHRHPLRDEALARPGQPVQPGAVLGLVRVGPLLLHVTAPRAGVVAAVITPEGAAVGYGTPLLRLKEA